jgi:LmbE family N-acetylglucosaminyl deacetylase
MIATSVAVVAALFAAAACFWRLYRYRRWFRLPPRRNDSLDFRATHHALALKMSAQGFDLPGDLSVSGTVLLRMTVTASLSGYLFDPYIEFQGDRQTHRQYFERGVAGQRYLNLTALFTGHEQGSFSRVQLRGSWLRWEAEAQLLVFNSPVVENAAVLVLAPHPDDAEIAAFGMYARPRSWVVTVTAGERATGILPAGIAPNERSRWAALLRVSDSLTVPQLGEVPPERLINLVCPDGALESMFREPSRAFTLACEAQLPRSQLRAKNRLSEFQQGAGGCTWNDLIDELQRLLELSQPDIVVCPHPQGDAHPDHIFTTVALARALQRIPGKRPLLLLYTVHSSGAPAHPFGPTNAVVGPPPGVLASWFLDSVYSFELTAQLQQTKQFAVEAMHAARRYAADEPAGGVAFLKAFGRQISGFLSGMGIQPASLLRRACRPNELYYVVRGEEVAALVEGIPHACKAV